MPGCAALYPAADIPESVCTCTEWLDIHRNIRWCLLDSLPEHEQRMEWVQDRRPADARDICWLVLWTLHRSGPWDWCGVSIQSYMYPPCFWTRSRTCCLDTFCASLSSHCMGSSLLPSVCGAGWFSLLYHIDFFWASLCDFIALLILQLLWWGISSKATPVLSYCLKVDLRCFHHWSLATVSHLFVVLLYKPNENRGYLLCAEHDP